VNFREGYWEELAHVIQKKNLFRKTSSEGGYGVGLLIPAPPSPSGEARWYENTALYDDTRERTTAFFCLHAKTIVTRPLSGHFRCRWSIVPRHQVLSSWVQKRL